MVFNGAAQHSPLEEFLMPPQDGTTLRLFTKLDDISSSVSTTQADVARIEGTQRGIELAIGVVKEAIGDVTATKIEVARTTEKMANVEKDLSDLKATLTSAETKKWVEGLVKWALGGLTMGSSYALAQRFF